MSECFCFGPPVDDCPTHGREANQSTEPGAFGFEVLIQPPQADEIISIVPSTDGFEILEITIDCSHDNAAAQAIRAALWRPYWLFHLHEDGSFEMRGFGGENYTVPADGPPPAPIQNKAIGRVLKRLAWIVHGDSTECQSPKTSST